MFSFFVVALSTINWILHSTDAAPFVVDLNNYSPGNGVKFTGTLSPTVAQIGDHNGDGFNDYMIGTQDYSKVVIVMKGVMTHSELMDIASVVSGQYLRVIRGPASSGLGSTVGGIGDINGDSFDDVILGAVDGIVPDRGSVSYAFVIFGMKGPFRDVTVTATWTASAIGFMILGPPGPSSGFVMSPRSALGLGDVNGDGVDDFALSAKYYAESRGVVWVVFGRAELRFKNMDLASATSVGFNGVHFTGAASGDYLGQAISPAGDFNNDGIADFLIGAHYAGFQVGAERRKDAGAAYLLYGSQTALSTSLDMATFVTGAMGVRFGGGQGYQLGYAVRGVGDVNGDAIDDIAIGCRHGYAEEGGIVFVIFGHTGTYAADVDLQDYAASSLGFAIYGSMAYTQLYSAAPAGDINGDGVGDLLLGDAKAARLVLGQAAPRSANLGIATANVISFYSPSTAMYVSSLDGGQDVNGDGISDLLLGSFNVMSVWILPGPFDFPAPTTPPSAKPTAVPSVPPTVSPTAPPSAEPTAVPSTPPTVSPTATPSMVPVTWYLGNTYQSCTETCTLAQGTCQPEHLLSVASPQAFIAVVDAARHVDSRLPVGEAEGLCVSIGEGNWSEAPSIDFSSANANRGHCYYSTLTSNCDEVYRLKFNRRFCPCQGLPSAAPTMPPSARPSARPTVQPTSTPSAPPSAHPSAHPSAVPTPRPSSVPSSQPSVQPTSQPSAKPSAQPSVQPTGEPTVQPSMVPSAQPTDVPSAIPSMQPSAQPSGKPSVNPTTQPSVAPSAQPAAHPSVQPSGIPSAQPSRVPSTQPTAEPSAQPSGKPSVQPSGLPSSQPSAVPSGQPSNGPSAQPAAHPSAQPTGIPSVQPSCTPSTQPTAEPSAQPSGEPSTQPSGRPSSQPSGVPSRQPTNDPSGQPSKHPSAQPSVQPSAVPSAQPSKAPSAHPSAVPSAQPSAQPSPAPTKTPTVIPSVSPSATPTVRPTIPAVKNFELSVNVLQQIFGLNKADYEAQKAASNRTIQHTVSSALPGVPPDSITDIQVLDTVAAAARVRAHAVTVGSVTIAYTLKVYDTKFSVEKLRTQLVQAANDGTMDSQFRHYAGLFNVTNFKNGFFAVPLITSAGEQRDNSGRLTETHIALVVVGAFVGLALLLCGLLFVYYRQSVTARTELVNVEHV